MRYNHRMTLQSIPAEKMAAYRAGLRRRLSRPLTSDEKTALESALREAEQIAQDLIKQHGAKRVILFGSVARQQRLRPDSDIDLAVEGMPVESYYQIVGDLWTEQGRRIDLIRLEAMRPAFRELVEREGKLLAHDDRC